MGFLNLLFKKFSYDKNLNKSEAYIEKMQTVKLKNLVKHAFRHSNFYQKILLDHNIEYEDIDNINLQDLPTTNKKMIMNNFDEVITDQNLSKEKVIDFIDNHPEPSALLEKKYHVIHSSGTSGEIGYYIYDNANWELLKAVGASRLFNGFGLKRKKYAFIGASDGHYAGISFFLSPVNRFEQYFYKDFLVMDINYPLKKYIQKLNKLQPDVISGYPSALRLLLDYQKSNELSINPQHVICGGEPLTQRAYEKIKKYWQIEPINYYGTSESILMGAGQGKDGLYIFDDLIILEIEDNKTYLTNLYNYTEPLIRYELNDLITKHPKIDKQWPFTYIENISGRQEDLLWFKNKSGQKDFIHPIVFAELHIKGIKKFQVVKENDLSLIFKIIPEENSPIEEVKQKSKERINEILTNKNMPEVNVKINLVDNIPNDPDTGKFRLIKKLD